MSFTLFERVKEVTMSVNCPKESNEDIAVRYHSGGASCSQAVLAAFASELNLPESTLLSMASPFATGMGRGEMCGTCIGALIAIGTAIGPQSVDDIAARKASREATHEFLQRFEEHFGSYLCRDLVAHKKIGVSAEAAAASNEKLVDASCRQCVIQSTKIASDIIAKHREQKN